MPERIKKMADAEQCQCNSIIVQMLLSETQDRSVRELRQPGAKQGQKSQSQQNSADGHEYQCGL